MINNYFGEWSNWHEFDQEYWDYACEFHDIKLVRCSKCGNAPKSKRFKWNGRAVVNHKFKCDCGNEWDFVYEV